MSICVVRRASSTEVTSSMDRIGDITPATRFASALTYLEAISGVMYVAILVASLVGAYASKGRGKDVAKLHS